MSTLSRAQRSRLVIPEAAFAIPVLCLSLFLGLGALARMQSAMSAGWALVYLLTAFWLIASWQKSLQMILRVWPLLILPGIALLSTTWSLAPEETLVHSIQFAFTTIIAIRVASVVSPGTALLCFFAVATIPFVLSLLTLIIPFVGPAFEPNGAFRGVFAQKTISGIAFVFFALSALAVSLRYNRPMLGLFCVLIAVGPIVMTKSVSALILFCGIVPILFARLFRRVGPNSRLGSALFIVSLSAVLIAVVTLSGVDLWAELLGVAGKSPSLTGRTDIWVIAWEIAERYPLLGTGYAAFWGNPDFAVEWGFLHTTVDPRLKGFHNIYLEALATTGPLGFIAVIGVYYWTLAWVFLYFVETGKVEALFWLVSALGGLAISFTDNVLFAEHELFHFFMTMIFVQCATRNSKLVLRFGHATRA